MKPIESSHHFISKAMLTVSRYPTYLPILIPAPQKSNQQSSVKMIHTECMRMNHSNSRTKETKQIKNGMQSIFVIKFIVKILRK